MMPDMATLMPASFLRGISSPKNMQPPIKMITVFMWPTTLYVSDDVAPITRNVDRLTCTPRRSKLSRHPDTVLKTPASVRNPTTHCQKQLRYGGAPDQCNRSQEGHMLIIKHIFFWPSKELLSEKTLGTSVRV